MALATTGSLAEQFVSADRAPTYEADEAKLLATAEAEAQVARDEEAQDQTQPDPVAT